MRNLPVKKSYRYILEKNHSAEKKKALSEEGYFLSYVQTGGGKIIYVYARLEGYDK